MVARSIGQDDAADFPSVAEDGSVGEVKVWPQTHQADQCAERLKRNNVDAHEDRSVVGTRLAHRVLSLSRTHPECVPGSSGGQAEEGCCDGLCLRVLPQPEPEQPVQPRRHGRLLKDSEPAGRADTSHIGDSNVAIHRPVPSGR
jgi:hypothetical protein